MSYYILTICLSYRLSACEHIFSSRRLLLPHVVQKNLSNDTVRTVALWLRQWSRLELVQDDDLEAAARLSELDGENLASNGDINDGNIEISLNLDEWTEKRR